MNALVVIFAKYDYDIMNTIEGVNYGRPGYNRRIQPFS